jgi:citrate lyase subunit beta/citryl-CoA lyase
VQTSTWGFGIMSNEAVGDISSGQHAASTPRRSVLYMPGANARALAKARSLPADVLIFDLEDAVAPDAKVLAREQVVAALRDGGYGAREIVVRINGLQTPWAEDDLAAVAPLVGTSAVLVPKIESGAHVRDVAGCVQRAGAHAGLHIWVMVETPKAILRLDQIASADALLEALVLGTSDLVNDLHARHTSERTEVLTALSMAVLAARAYGLTVLDGVHLALDDDSGLRRSCEQGRTLGFDGKTLIHPSQIAAANEIFGPNADEILQARRRVDAFAAARAAGAGIAVVDGRLVEELHIRDATRLLALADAISKRG